VDSIPCRSGEGHHADLFSGSSSLFFAFSSPAFPSMAPCHRAFFFFPRRGRPPFSPYEVSLLALALFSRLLTPSFLTSPLAWSSGLPFVQGTFIFHVITCRDCPVLSPFGSFALLKLGAVASHFPPLHDRARSSRVPLMERSLFSPLLIPRVHERASSGSSTRRLDCTPSLVSSAQS